MYSRDWAENRFPGETGNEIWTDYKHKSTAVTNNADTPVLRRQFQVALRLEIFIRPETQQHVYIQ